MPSGLVISRFRARPLLPWALLWIGIAAVIAATGIAGAGPPAPAPLLIAAQAPSEVSTIAPGITARVTAVEMSAGETVVRVTVTGREDLGAYVAYAGPSFLIDSAGARHFEAGGAIDGRVLTLRFPGSATVASGRGVAEVNGLGLTLDRVAGPGLDSATVRGKAAIVTELKPMRGDAVRTAVNERREFGPGFALVNSIVRDEGFVVVQGELEGFSRESIQSLDLAMSTLILGDGSEIRINRGRSGFGEGLRSFELTFDSSNAATTPSQLVLRLRVRVPDALKASGGDVAARLSALELSDGATVLIAIPR